LPAFDDNDLDRIRQAISIADLIGGYVQLKQRGTGDFWGRCPFHGEKTASFHVRADRGMFHCFGCGKGGNVFTFLMEIEHLSFGEAVRLLSDRAGISLRSQSGASGARQRDEKEQMAAVNAFAVKWFHERLITGTPSASARRALEYLTGRGLGRETIVRFKIGWAEPEWDAFSRAANKTGYRDDLLVASGLAYRRRDGSGVVDRFRARIIFPIHSITDRAVAFGARRVEGITPDDDEAKYLNSPETPLYHKGEHLYGLDIARDAIKSAGNVFIVEGYLDLLALVRGGFPNAVASLGTALTRRQAQLLERYASRAVVVYDGDDAGIAAAARAGDLLTESGIEAHIVRLPEGEDPDSILRSNGPEALGEALARPLSLVNFRLEAAGFHRSLPPSVQIRAVRDILGAVAGVVDPVRRDLLLGELQQATGLTRNTLDRALSDIPKPDAPSPDGTAATPAPDFGPEFTGERDLIVSLLRHPEFLNVAMREVTSAHFEQTQLKALYARLESAFLRGEAIDSAALFEATADPAVKQLISRAAVEMSENAEPGSAERAVRDAAKSILRRSLRRRHNELRIAVATAERNHLPTADLMREMIALQRQMRELSAG